MKTYPTNMNRGSQLPLSDGSSQSSINFSITPSVNGAAAAAESRNTIESKQSKVSSRHVTAESLKVFYEKFGNFMECIKSIQEGSNLHYNFQSALEETLNMEAKELELMYTEVRAVVNNVDRLKNQRKAIRKEKIAVERILNKIEDEECQELEDIVLANDKVMFSRWEMIKTSKEQTVLENFLNDVEGKFQAMRSLKQLVSGRLNQISLERKPKQTKKQETFAPARDSRRKRARTRGARIRVNDNLSTLSIYTPDEASYLSTAQMNLNSLDEASSARASLETINSLEPGVSSDIQYALNTLFGAAASQASSNSSNKINSSPSSSDIQLILTPIINRNSRVIDQP